MSFIISIVITLGRMKYMGHVAHREEARYMNRILIGKPKEKETTCNNKEMGE
jgi:hypothetical protein